MQHQHINFISALRGPAALVVVYAHLVATFADRQNISYYPVEFVRNFITSPTGIIQDFGWFGVCLFFLISGFIITHTIRDESATTFFIKRAFRIYPVFFASVFAIILFKLLNGAPLPEFGKFLAGLTLAGIWPDAKPIRLNPVEWTLIIEIRFYALTLLLFPLYRRDKLLGMLAMIALVAASLHFARDFGAAFHLFNVGISYLPFLLQGQALYLLHARAIGLKTFAALFAICYALSVYGIAQVHPKFLETGNSYMTTFWYAYLIFVICWLLNDRLRKIAVVEFFSNISYSLYLFHGIFGLALLRFLLQFDIPHTLRLAIAVGTVIGIAYISFRFLEKPAVRAARQVIARLPARTPTPETMTG